MQNFAIFGAILTIKSYKVHALTILEDSILCKFNNSLGNVYIFIVKWNEVICVERMRGSWNDSVYCVCLKKAFR